jgi:uncharacterized protein
MQLEARLRADLIDAQKRVDADRVGTLRFLIAQCQNRAIEKRTAGKDPVLTDEDVLDVLGRERKKCAEAIALYAQGGRADLADKERRELSILEAYLPAQLGRDEIVKVVQPLIAGGAKEFPALMKAAMGTLKGKADGALVSQVIRELLEQ